MIVFAPDGTLYVAAQDAAGGTPHVWVREIGAAWRHERPSRQSGGEIDIAAGIAGDVLLTQLGPQGNLVSVSHDHGETWTASPLAGLAQYFDREWAAYDSDGRAYIVARQFGQDAAATVSRSDDDGITFLARGRAWDAANEPGSMNGNLVASSGALLMPYVCRDATAICLARSVDRGVTWTQSVVVERAVPVDNVYPSLAADGSAAYVAWSDAAGGRLSAWIARSADGGATWSAPVLASDAESESATFAWVAARGGRVWVAYLSTADDLDAADGAPADRSEWRAVAARLDAGATRVVERGALLDEPVHVGVLSKPVGRPESAGPYDRTFGDFYTVAVAPEGALVAALAKTHETGVDNFIVAEDR